MFRLKLNKLVLSNFHPLEVVCRGSETQLQVGENLNNLIFSASSVKCTLCKTTDSDV